MADAIATQDPIKNPVNAQCMKCKDKRVIKDPERTVLENGREAVRGICPECGTKVFRIGHPE